MSQFISLSIDYLEQDPFTAWKVSKYGVFSGPSFPVFGLKTEIYSKSPYSVRIQENKDQKKNSAFGHFSRSVFFLIRGLHKIFGVHW